MVPREPPLLYSTEYTIYTQVQHNFIYRSVNPIDAVNFEVPFSEISSFRLKCNCYLAVILFNKRWPRVKESTFDKILYDNGQVSGVRLQNSNVGWLVASIIHAININSIHLIKFMARISRYSYNWEYEQFVAFHN